VDDQEKVQSRPVLIVAWLAMFLVSFDVASLTIAMPSIADDMSVGTSIASWGLLSYMLVMSGLLLPAGSLLHIYGTRSVLLTGLCLFALGSGACALSETMLELIAYRAIQGVGGAILYVTGPAMIRRMVPERLQSGAFALFTTAASAGMSLGPPIGGLLTYNLGWPWIFLVNLPLCAVGAIVILFSAKSGGMTETEDSNIDLVGLLLFVVAVTCIVFGLNQGRELGWHSTVILGCFVTGLLALAGFIFRELRSNDPALDLRLFKRPAFSLGNIGVFGLTFVTGGLLFLMPFYLEWYRGFDTGMSGYMMLVQPVSMILVSAGIAFAVTTDRITGFLAAGTGTLVLAMVILAFAAHSTWLLIIAGALGLIGVSRGLYLPKAQHLVMSRTTRTESGVGSAVNSIVRVLAQMFGIVVFETVFSQRYLKPAMNGYGDPTTTQDFLQLSTAFQTVFWLAAATALIALVPCLLPLADKFISPKIRENLPDDPGTA